MTDQLPTMDDLLDYPWQGGVGKQWEQVGNAVPPPLAAALIDAVRPQ